MAPKGGNAKKESGRAKKAENESKKQQVAEVAKVRTIYISIRFTVELIVYAALLGTFRSRQMARRSQDRQGQGGQGSQTSG